MLCVDWVKSESRAQPGIAQVSNIARTFFVDGLDFQGRGYLACYDKQINRRVGDGSEIPITTPKSLTIMAEGLNFLSN